MNLKSINHASGAALGLILAGGVFAVLSVAVKLAVTAPEINAARAAERSAALAEITTNEAVQLSGPGWVDESRGIVRLPIESAIKLAATKWQDPAAARADLKARAENAAAPAAPAPPKPSAFE